MPGSRKGKYQPLGTGVVPSKTKLGKFIRERRMALNLSQVQLAQKIGCQSGLVSALEIGKNSGQNQVEVFAKSLDCDPEELKALIPRKDPQTELGKLLRNLREEAGLSLDDLSAKTRVGKHTLFIIETSDRATLRQKTAQRFSEVLGVDISVFKDFYPRYQNGDGEGIGELGKFVRKRRLELGLTLEDVGQAIGVKRESIRQLESGKIIWQDNADYRQKLASVLKVQVDILPTTRRKLPDRLKHTTSRLGSFLTEKRKATGLSQRKLAELAQLSLPTINYAERFSKVSAKSLRSIAQALN